MGIARGKIYVDVGFWGGLVPSNAKELLPLLAAGVIGLQCTLCGSSEPVGAEFAATSETQLRTALKELSQAGETEALIAFHAELPLPPTAADDDDHDEEANPRAYASFLRTRPAAMELEAVRLICQLAGEQPLRRFHIINLSAAQCLPLLTDCQRQTGAQLTADTCPHYLALSAEQVPDCGTEWKTWPPIREAANQQPLWQALLEQQASPLQLIASDHSAATPGARCLIYGSGRGNFLKAWPGISSLQLSLPVVWTRGQQLATPLSLPDVHRLMCWQPAQLCGISHFKGRIAEGYDADFCIWSPEEQFNVCADSLHAANKSATPYAGQRLSGVVHATVVRGLHVYQQFEGFGQPLGKLLLRKSSHKLVKKQKFIN
ncbi:allantoinase isoform X2 [Drosophila busckii]|nr:allantoinase isoform X2 [Drosophila busckii]